MGIPIRFRGAGTTRGRRTGGARRDSCRCTSRYGPETGRRRVKQTSLFDGEQRKSGKERTSEGLVTLVAADEIWVEQDRPFERAAQCLDIVVEEFRNVANGPGRGDFGCVAAVR